MICGLCAIGLVCTWVLLWPRHKPDPWIMAFKAVQEDLLRLDVELQRDKPLVPRAPVGTLSVPARTTALADFLKENPASPLGLLVPENAEMYLASTESLQTWASTVDQLTERDTSQVDMDLWQICREHMALRFFIVSYQNRERTRWAAHERSVSLETELQPVQNFIQAHYGDDAELWRLINAYSTEVIDQIHSEGVYPNRGDDVQSTWDLQSALVHAGAPAFDAVVAIILGDTR